MCCFEFSSYSRKLSVPLYHGERPVCDVDLQMESFIVPVNHRAVSASDVSLLRHRLSRFLNKSRIREPKNLEGILF